MNLEEALYRSEKLEEGLWGDITKPVKAIGKGVGNVMKDTIKGALTGAATSTLNQFQNGLNSVNPLEGQNKTQKTNIPQPSDQQNANTQQNQQATSQDNKITNEEIQALQKECGKILKVLGQTIGGGEKDANGQSVKAQQKNVEKGKFSSPDEGQVSLKVNNGDQVKKGTIIAKIKNNKRETPVKAHQDGYVSFLVNNRNKVPKGKVIGSISSNPPVQQESKREQRISKLMEVGFTDRVKQVIGNKDIGLSQEDKEILNNFNKVTSDTITVDNIKSVLDVLQRLSSNKANVKSALNMANNIHQKLVTSQEEKGQVNEVIPSDPLDTGETGNTLELFKIVDEIRKNLQPIMKRPELVKGIKKDLEEFNASLKSKLENN